MYFGCDSVLIKISFVSYRVDAQIQVILYKVTIPTFSLLYMKGTRRKVAMLPSHVHTSTSPSPPLSAHFTLSLPYPMVSCSSFVFKFLHLWKKCGIYLYDQLLQNTNNCHLSREVKYGISTCDITFLLKKFFIFTSWTFKVLSTVSQGGGRDDLPEICVTFSLPLFLCKEPKFLHVLYDNFTVAQAV